MYSRLLTLLAALLLLTACRPAANEATVAEVAVSPAAPVQPTPPPLPTVTSPATAVPLPTAAVTILPTTTPDPTATPAPTATPTPLPMVVAVPEWLPQLAADPPVDTGRYGWTVLPASDPAATLAAGEAQVALLPAAAVPAGMAQVDVGDRPVALVVPFDALWEATNFDYANDQLGRETPPFALQDWAALTPQQKALAVDGRYPHQPDYPFRQPWQLAGPDPDPLNALQPWAAARLNDEPLLTLAAVGDIMLDRALGYAIAVQNQPDFPFAQVADRLRSADITVGNFESALGSGGTPAPKSYTFRAPPAAALSVADAGFDLLSLANNHALDFGAATLLEGIDLLAAQGIATVGAGADSSAARAPHITTVNGLTVAFLAYVHVPVEGSGFDTATWTAGESTPGLAWADPAIVAADVAAVAPQVDHVVVLLHSGFEYVVPPSPPQQAAAYAAVDAGAALVIGHHAHILQGVEFYGAGVIVHGLGNFAFEIDGDPRTAILNVWLDARGVRQLTFTPALIQFGGQPRPATLAEAEEIRRLIYQRSTPLNGD